MEKNIYNQQDYAFAMSYIGKEIVFFLKTQLPYAKEAQAWGSLPMIGLMFGFAKIDGLRARVNKMSTAAGTIDQYTDMKFIIKNPYYVKENESDDRDGPGWPPPPNVNNTKEWHIAVDAMNKWFFESKELALKSITDCRSIYYPFS